VNQFWPHLCNGNHTADQGDLRNYSAEINPGVPGGWNMFDNGNGYFALHWLYDQVRGGERCGQRGGCGLLEG